MNNQINPALNPSGLFQNNIRISSNSKFSMNNSFEKTFGEKTATNYIPSQEIQNGKESINFYNLGMPAGFNIDTSLIEE